MADLRIAYTEEMVGSGHPTKSDTLNRLALVEHNADGTHKYLRNDTLDFDLREWLPEGFVTDGTADYSSQIQEAVDYIESLASGTGGVLQLPLGYWHLGEGAAGLTLPEGITVRGQGRPEYVNGDMAGGTWLIYDGTGDCLKVDGEWSGFNARRNICLEGFGVKLTGANSFLNADFLTQFRLTDLNVRGSSTYGIYALNSYNGLASRVKIDGPDNALYFSIKDSPNDVFSGQMLFEKCDFWNGTGKGIHIKTNVNVLAQMVFLACHFKTNAYGAYIEGANMHRVNFRGCHFEANTTNDLYVHSDVTQGPIVDGCHFNNTGTVYMMNCQGDKANIIGNEFAGTGTGWGILNNGDDNYIARNHFQGLANSKQIVVDTDATYSIIGKNTFSNSTGRVVDNSTAGTTSFEGETILESKEFDLSASVETEVKFVALRDYWIRDVSILYVEGTSGDAGVALQFGDSDSLTRYVSHTSDVSQSNYTVVTPTLASAYIARNRKLTFRCAGSKTGAGTAKFVARLLPFANI